MLEHQIPWFVAGPVMGLCVVMARALFNARLGVTGGFSELVGKLSRRSTDFDWRGWFAIGIVAGSVLFVLAAGVNHTGHGWLTETFTGADAWLVAPILMASGVLIGYGAKVAGGCTSGNGLSGTSGLSPASLVATATFFATAIVVSVAVEAVI